MQNSSCPNWRALEGYRGDIAAQESEVIMLVCSKAPVDPLILFLYFSDSQQVTENEPCMR